MPSTIFEALLPAIKRKINKGKLNNPTFNPLIFKLDNISKLNPNKLKITIDIIASKASLIIALNPSLFF